MTNPRQSDSSLRGVRAVALVAGVGIAVHLVLRFSAADLQSFANVPLYVALLTGGLPLVVQLGKKLWAGEFGSDFLAGVSIVTAIVLREYLVAAIVVFMTRVTSGRESDRVRASQATTGRRP